MGQAGEAMHAERVHERSELTASRRRSFAFMAYRAFERGELLLAGVFAFTGIVLTIYRYRAATKRTCVFKLSTVIELLDVSEHALGRMVQRGA